ncbi:hypothetical protein MRX96_017564 [Rhipicephalus microplus]
MFRNTSWMGRHRHRTPALWATVAVIFWSCGLARLEASPNPEDEDSTTDSSIVDRRWLGTLGQLELLLEDVRRRREQSIPDDA